MRVVAACTIALMLAGCTSPQREAEQQAAKEKVAGLEDCVVRETQIVAPQPIDLDTATYAVMARCDYPGAVEKELVAEHPGYREEIREMMQKRYPGDVDTIRRGIALLRSAGAAKALKNN